MKYVMTLLAAAMLTASAAHAAQNEPAAARLAYGGRIVVGAPRGVDPVVYDATGASLTITTGTPRTYIGGVANIAGAGPQVDITSLDLSLASAAAVTYTNIRARVQFWDVYTAAGTPVFSSPAGTPIEIDLGPQTLTANNVYTVTVNLAAPLRLNSLTGKGFGVNFQGDTGAGLVDDTNLTTALTYGSAQPVGTSGVNAGNGFYRNASGRTDFNFASTDLRTFTGITDTRTMLVLRGNASVPVSLQTFNVD
ncbi:hypothetical protein [Tahibacter caeni]|uniref:hypothetical protein n=1 Tax=Tahibacter caeni TaxID=1453545 RepID=UPI00214735F8|nr:hypothetical protein [Tahibacter caeni]